MITFFSNLFIKDKNNTKNPEVRQAYGMLCGGVGIFLNVLLFFGKLIAGVISHSISITADAFNNLSDAGSSVITLIGFKLSGQKPDPEHPFGHGRIEYISGFVVSLSILIMAFELIKSSVTKIIHPEPISFSPVIVIILVVSILVKLYMAYYNTKIAKLIDSAAMKATATDSISDCRSTLAVLAVTLITHYANLSFPFDGICGVFVGILIFFAGIGAAKDTINPLLGQAPDPDFVKRIEKIVLSYPCIVGIHDLIVHDYGPGRIIISLHAEVSANDNILVLHDTIDNIEKALHKELNCSASIHMDPIKIDDEETKLLKEQVTYLIKEINPTLTLHDFRIVTGPTHTNLLFDIVNPFDSKLEDKELAALVSEKITALNPSYFAIIEVDRAYC